MPEKKKIGWHIAGLVLAVILLCAAGCLLFLGVYGFESGCSPVIDGKILYAVPENPTDIPTGSAVILDTEKQPERGLPTAYADEETGKIQLKYFYGEEDGMNVLTDRNSDDVSLVTDEAICGSVVCLLAGLGGALGFVESLGGVCVLLVAVLLLLLVIVLILRGMLKKRGEKETVVVDSPDELIAMAETEEAEETSEAEELPEQTDGEEPTPEEEQESDRTEEEEPAGAAEQTAEEAETEDAETEVIPEESADTEPAEEPDPEPQPIQVNEGILAKELPAEEGKKCLMFWGDPIEILKFSKLLRVAAEKKNVAITVEEFFENDCRLQVTAEEKDFALVDSIVAMIRNREQ